MKKILQQQILYTTLLVILLSNQFYAVKTQNQDSSQNQQNNNTTDSTQQDCENIDIIKSPNDNRQYRFIKLENQLEAILISDPEADKSAVSLDVKVGSALDTPPYFGLEHFLEHMLFMGSEKYPNENEFIQSVSNNAGRYNAFTSNVETNYYFDASNEGFNQTLDIFAQFFIDPLFSESATYREMQAVDSEYRQTLTNDDWKLYSLLQNSSNPEGRFSKFMIGSLETLNQTGIREALLAFHQQWYSANIMKLAVVSNQTLDTIEAQIREQFGQIENKSVTVPDLNDPISIRPEDLGQLIKFVPVQDENVLTIFWVFPYNLDQYKTQPMIYLDYLMSNKGENSLLSYLISQGLALDLEGSIDSELWSYSTYYLDIYLTEKGLQNVDQVIEAVFQYVKMLQEKGVQQYIFDEIKQMADINFQYSEKQDALTQVRALSSTLQYFNCSDISEILRLFYGPLEFNATQIQELFDQILDPQSFDIIIRSKSFQNQTDQFEPLEQTYFSREPFSNELIQLITNPNITETTKKLDLPPRNNLIPKSFDILPEDPEYDKQPVLIKSWNETNVWYYKDDTFKIPKAIVEMKIYTNDAQFGLTPEGRVFAEVWVAMINEYLREFNYQASQANLGSSISVRYDNIDIQWNGFDDTLPEFILETFRRIKEFDPSEQEAIFNQVKESLLNDWYNFYYQRTYQVGLADFESLIVDGFYERSKLRQILENLTFEQFVEMEQTWLQNGQTLWLITGNLSKDEAIDLTSQARDILDLQAIQIEDLGDIRTVALEPNITYLIEKPVADPSNTNSAIISYFQGELEGFNLTRLMLHTVLMQFISEPAFNYLRTVQQLGYVVGARNSQYRDVLGTQLVVQSSSFSNEYSANVINQFLDIQRQNVQNLTDEEFNTQVQAVITLVGQKDINLAQVHNRYWNEIANHKYIFDRQERELEILRNMTKQQFQDYFEDLFFRDRKRIDYELNAQAQQESQQQWKELNQQNYYTNSTYERQEINTTYLIFKMQHFLFPDDIKANYALYEPYQASLNNTQS